MDKIADDGQGEGEYASAPPQPPSNAPVSPGGAAATQHALAPSNGASGITFAPNPASSSDSVPSLPPDSPSRPNKGPGSSQRQAGQAAASQGGGGDGHHRVFSLFDRASWTSLGDQADGANGEASNAKRPRRAAAARGASARKSNEAAFLQAFQRGYQHGTAETDSSGDDVKIVSSKVRRSKGKRQTKGPEQGLGQRSEAGPSCGPLTNSDRPAGAQPISLKVRGTVGAEQPDRVHLLFRSRPKAARIDDGPDASRPDNGQASREQPCLTKPKTKPPIEAPWPDAMNIHVNALPTPRSSSSNAHELNRPYLAAIRRNGKARAREAEAHDWTILSSQTSQITRNDLRKAPQVPVPLWTAEEALRHLEEHIAPSPEMLQKHPALQTILESARRACMDGSPERSDERMWPQRFQPQRAVDVLGNEAAAVYLRDWLRELQLRPNTSKSAEVSGTSAVGGLSAPATSKEAGKQRRRVVQTRVSRPKTLRRDVHGRRPARRSGLSSDEDATLKDFIVDDSEEEDAWLEQFYPKSAHSAIDEDECQDEPLPSGEAGMDPETHEDRPPLVSDVVEPFDPDSRLTNCIVLAGPAGSGKTAAVYTCATELGFDVFEISPGSRKRSGKELVQAVGDLGRNHMVGKSSGAGGPAQRLVSKLLAGHGASTQAPMEAEPAQGERVGSPAMRQSLILIEEVDILYEEDRGFWGGVVDLVAESKRPVVLTCNDLSQVPVESLPIQVVLPFTAPPSVASAPYVRMLALAAGHIIDVPRQRGAPYSSPEARDGVDSDTNVSSTKGKLESFHGTDWMQHTPHWTPSHPEVSRTHLGDLRQEIIQTQLDVLCRTDSQGNLPGGRWTRPLESSPGEARSHDNLSKRGEGVEPLDRLRELIRRAETLSYAEDALALPFARWSDLYEGDDSGEPSSAVVLLHGHSLPKSLPETRATGLAVCDRTEELREALLGPRADDPASGLPRAPGAEEEESGSRTRLAREVPVVEVAPAVRAMVAHDESGQAAYDAQVAAALETQRQELALDSHAGSSGGAANVRSTRNSTRLLGVGGGLGGYERWLRLDAGAIEAARASALRTDVGAPTSGA